MADSDDAMDRWLDFAQSAARLGLELTGLPQLSSVLDLIRALLGLNEGDSQTRLLKSIKQDTELIRSKEFNSARAQLAEACTLGPAHPLYRSRIYEAYNLLFTAHGAASSRQERALVEFHLSMVYLAMDDEESCKRWAEVTSNSAGSAFEELVQQAQRGLDVYPRLLDAREDAALSARSITARGAVGALQLASHLPPLGTAAVMSSYATQSRKKAKRIDEVARYLPFRNLAQGWNDRLQDRPMSMPLVLRKVKKPSGDADDPRSLNVHKFADKDYMIYFVLTYESDKTYDDRVRALPSGGLLT
jgi:hypothetical protein